MGGLSHSRSARSSYGDGDGDGDGHSDGYGHGRRYRDGDGSGMGSFLGRPMVLGNLSDPRPAPIRNDFRHCSHV